MYIFKYGKSNDNISAEKENIVARMISNNYTLDSVFDEIEKCIVLCANCHREFHYLNKRNPDLTLEAYLK